MAQVKSAPTAGPLLSIGPIAGLDASTDPYFVDGSYAIDMLNIVPNRTYKGYATIRGRTQVPFTMVGTKPLALGLFYKFPTSVFPIIYAFDTQAGLQGFEYFTHGSGWSGIAVPSSAPIAPNPGMFVTYLGWTFFANADPDGQTYKFDKNQIGTYWQTAPPTTAPTGTISTTTTSAIYGEAYYWVYTYSNSQIESSPSPPLGPFNLGTTLGPPGSNTAATTQNAAPTLSGSTASGSVPSGTYIARVTYIDSGGNESEVSAASTAVVLGSNGELTVTPTSVPPSAISYNVYIASGTHLGHLQGSPNPVGSPVTITSYDDTSVGPPPFLPGLASPPAPSLTYTTGGTLPARTEYYVLTYTNSGGEGFAGPEASIDIPANNLAVIQSPAPLQGATGYNVYGSETSQQEVKQTASPIAIGTNWTEPTTGLVLGQQIALVAVGSTDPQVTTINWYRIGGSLGQWLLTGSVPNAAGSVNYTDNNPDSAVVGQPLVQHRDQPAPFNAIWEHKERVWGFGYPAYSDVFGAHDAAPCDLWYSNYVEPWGFDNTNQVIQLGAHDSGDVGVNGGSLGDIAFAVKTKTAWAVYGQSPSDFFAQKLFDVGCASKFSFCIALGVAFWLSNQGVYMFDGSNLQYLSGPIKKILDSFSSFDFNNAWGIFSDRIYWLVFPTQGISLGYDTVSQTWWKSNMTSTVFVFDTEAPNVRPTAPDLVYALDPNGSMLDQWFSQNGDLGGAIGSAVTTRLLSSGPSVGTLRVRYVELLAASLGGGDSLLVTVKANPSFAQPPAFVQGFTQGAYPRQVLPVPPGVQGQELQLTLAAVSTDALVVEGAAVHGWQRRGVSYYGS